LKDIDLAFQQKDSLIRRISIDKIDAPDPRDWKNWENVGEIFRKVKEIALPSAKRPFILFHGWL